MSSFFEKLKKGMGAEAEIEKPSPAEESAIENPDPQTQEKTEESESARKPKKQRVKKVEKITEEQKVDVNNKQEPASAEDTAVKDKPMEQKNEVKIEKESKEKWSSFDKSQEGQLAIDVYQTEEFLVLQSAIAGVKPDSLDIVIEGDMVSIKGNREKPEEKAERNYFYQECFWGPFSRQIILSVEVDPARAEAILKEGILTIKLPRIERDKKRKLVVKG